jgi:hypothetical protein
MDVILEEYGVESVGKVGVFGDAGKQSIVRDGNGALGAS